MVCVAKSRKKGRRFEIETEHGEVYRLPAVTVLTYGIYVDAEFTQARWDEIIRSSQLEECFARLVTMLNRRAHTVLEVRRKLYKKEFPDEIVTATVARATEAGLLDDAAFARAFVEERSQLGRYGRSRIEADLGRRGVDRQLVQAAFEALAERTGHGEDMELQNALEAARRKWDSLQRVDDPQKRKQRLLSFLAGRGFGAGVCYRVLDLLQAEER